MAAVQEAVQAAERRLTEYLNRYVTYALRTFAVHLEVRGNPKSSDAIRIRRMLAELEGERPNSVSEIRTQARECTIVSCGHHDVR